MQVRLPAPPRGRGGRSDVFPPAIGRRQAAAAPHVSPTALQRYQVAACAVAIILGLLAGTASPAFGATLEPALWPLLGLLLFVTFMQTPLGGLREAFADRRFFAAAVVGNFVVVPPLAWGLAQLAPDDPAVRVGVLLVLLLPCTDWFIVFAQLGGADTRRAIAFTPLSLLLQMLLLPACLWLFLGSDTVGALLQRELLLAFLALIVAPLALAALLQRRVARAGVRRSVALLPWLPVPLLALVVFAVAASQADAALAGGSLFVPLALLFVAYLLLAPAMAWLIARATRLPPASGRVLAFSLGSRNSFVALPLALALPDPFRLAALVIVFQSLVELGGMLGYLRWVPRLFPVASGTGGAVAK